MSVARIARPTIRFVDEYCQLFEGLFPEVRSYEAFKLLHLGMISEIKRKSLPAIAKAVGLEHHHCLASLSHRISLDSSTVASKAPRGNSQSPARKSNDFVD